MNPYRSFLDRFERTVKELNARAFHEKCADGCTECCHTRSVLPVEALPLLEQVIDLPRDGRPVDGDPAGTCPFLVEGIGCRVSAARPFVCRTHGLSILFLNPDGEWASNGCPCQEPHLVSIAEGMDAFPLHVWNAELNRINLDFCARYGIPSRRIRLAELARGPQEYLPLLRRIPQRELRAGRA
jgi:uncharacterized protein